MKFYTIILSITLLMYSFCENAYSIEKNSELNSQKKTLNRPSITKEILGNILFNDPELSNPSGQSCSSCHHFDKHFSDAGKDVREGAVKDRIGFRNTPSLKYVMTIPPLTGGDYENWQGGLFWDGRANTLEEQALSPLFNPLEMNNTEAGLAKKLKKSTYIQHFKTLYGEDVTLNDKALAAATADSLAAFQRTELFSPFDSKYDYVQAGLIEFTAEEAQGKKIFNGGGPGFGNCLDCHSGTYQSYDMFTRYIHHNILVPPNTHLAFYTQPKKINPDGQKFIDLGTARNPRVIASPAEGEVERAKGIFRTPSLRNIAETAPYMHNGSLKTLEEGIDFYVNMEDFWPAEVNANRSTLISTALEINSKDKAALLAFLNTLTDGYPASKELKNKLKKIQHERLKKN